MNSRSLCRVFLVACLTACTGSATDATPERAAPVEKESSKRSEPLLRRGTLAGFNYLEIVHHGSAEQRLPVLVLFHGLGDYPRYPYRLLGPIRMPLRVIIPEAPLVSGNGFSWFSVRVREQKNEVLAKETAQ